MRRLSWLLCLLLAVSVQSNQADDRDITKIRDNNNKDDTSQPGILQGIGAVAAQIQQAFLAKTFQTVQVKMRSRDSASAQVKK